MPIASLTALGSASGDVAGAVAAIVDYLEGQQSITASVDAPVLNGGALVGYYADTKSSDSLGWWSGRGINGTRLTGSVDPALLAQVLLGRHPHTGEQLVAATGSAGRATSRASSRELLTVADVAEELGVSTQRVGQLVAAGTRRAELTAAGQDPSSVSSWLTGHKQGREWRFEPDEVERHATTRTTTRTTLRPNLGPEGELTVADVAETLGVSSQRVRALAAAGAKRQELLDNGEDVDHLAQWLTGRRNAKQWLFDRAEIARAADARTVPRVVVAYDFTLSVEKSISLAWVHADTEQRAVIEEALRHGVQAGVSHLEDHGLAVRRNRGANTADGVWAASYLHLTNRNLEPQLHVHTVIVNVAADASTGNTQTIDGRGLFREVTAAGYLAGAEIRATLADRLGLVWDRAHKGTMEVAGVPDTAIVATSTRRAEVIALADELGYASAKSRQIAALSTRAPKQHPEDFDALVESWQALLAAHGFGPADADAILNSRVVRSGVEAECLVRADAATEMVGRDHAATGPQVAAGPAATSPGPDAATVYRRYTQLPDAPGPVLGLDAAQTADLFVWLAIRPLPRRSLVVLWPAENKKIKVAISSSRVSCWPCSSAKIIELRMSSRGFLRRASTRPSR